MYFLKRRHETALGCPESAHRAECAHAALFLMLLAASLLMVGCSDTRRVVPPQLWGTWATEAPEFEGRFMKIAAERVFFGTGETEIAANVVVQVRLQERDRTTAYEIDYLAPDGGEFKLSLELDKSTHVLRLVNRQQVAWRKIDERRLGHA